MNTIVFLYTGNSSNKIPVSSQLFTWAKTVPSVSAVVLLGFVTAQEKEMAQNCTIPVEIISLEEESIKELLHKIDVSMTEKKGDTAVYGWADCPFYNTELTKKIVTHHEKYGSEYTFADGYPYGLVPEVIHSGTVKILCSLLDKKPEANKKVTRDSIFSLLKTDINSFDIETILSETDYRYLRLTFSTQYKRDRVVCQILHAKYVESYSDEKERPWSSFDAERLCQIAANSEKVLRTIPSFFNIQITSDCQSGCIYCPYGQKKMFSEKTKSIMGLDQFTALLSDINSFAPEAVLCLSALGDPLYHPQFVEFVRAILSYPGFSVFIETTGEKITQEMGEELSQITNNCAPRTNGQEKMYWVISLDAETENMYQKLHPCAKNYSLTQAKEKVLLLMKYFPETVYPQFLRIKQNEVELEAFYRFWKAVGKGELIIQKYNSYCGLLSDEKVVDLEPVKRNPCWHLRRDMTILVDGTVPVCFCNETKIGNVFSEHIEDVWKKGESWFKNHNKLESCKACDEYYTFNF